MVYSNTSRTTSTMSSYNAQPQSSVTGTMPSQTEINTSPSEATNNSYSNDSVTGNGYGGGSGEFGDETTRQHANQEGLPDEQRHAGVTGYGPNYANKNRATLVDKVAGVKEQLVGKITNNPELVQKGHDRKTGELKRSEQENETDPFATEDKQDSSAAPGTTTGSTVQAAPNEDMTGGTRGHTGPYGVSSTDGYTAPGESRLNTDPYPSQYKENVTQPGEL